MKSSDLQEISGLLGLSYESWLQKAREILQLPDSPLSVSDGVWRVSRRAELLQLLGSRILDQNLDLFKDTAIKVLKEPDPSFDLAAEERYAASIYGKVPSYSPAFRKGLAEGLALISNNPNALPNTSVGKPEAIGVVAIREILGDASWKTWGSLNSLLPTLAEAAPKEFLDAVDRALQLESPPFIELFAQEGSGLTGGNYLTGLLWALEGLAWEPDLLVRVCLLLAELATHDPGGTWANRPSNSLATILLPWLPQTFASADKRIVAVQAVLAEQPRVGWNLLLQLLPGQHQISSGSHKPKWRSPIPAERNEPVPSVEYWAQVSAYSDLAIRAADSDPSRLSELISRLDDLASPSFDALLAKLKTREISELLPTQRREIWDALVSFSSKHRKFADAGWALPSDLVARIEETAALLQPEGAFELYQHLFSDRDFDLYEENGDWEEQRDKLDKKREVAILELLTSGGIREVVRFAEVVKSARQVGHALGGVADASIDEFLLPAFLDFAPGKLKNLVDAYIWRRYSLVGDAWCEEQLGLDWSLKQKAEFLSQLPFTLKTWERAARFLGKSEGLYWTDVWVNPYQPGSDLPLAISKLLEFNRPHAAIEVMHKMLLAREALKVEHVVEALLLAVSDPDAATPMNTHYVLELITFLQSQPSIRDEDLFRVEWSYLPLIHSRGQGKPKLLENKLASEPSFFCEAIRTIYRSDKTNSEDENNSEADKATATNVWRLLHEWSTPPGSLPDGSFSGARFIEWLDSTKHICASSGHLKVALIHTGNVLIHTPDDVSGFWIDRTVAAALNARDHDAMRTGFTTAVFNSRGVHWVDPTGQPERDLAEEYNKKAEEVENAGFPRFASSLREVATWYMSEAGRIASDRLGRIVSDD